MSGAVRQIERAWECRPMLNGMDDVALEVLYSHDPEEP